jgi:antitoxin VapB
MTQSAEQSDQQIDDVILCRKSATWDDLFAAVQAVNVPADFLSDAERAQGSYPWDPLDGL